MNITTNLLEVYIHYVGRMQSMHMNFVDTARIKKSYFKIVIVVFVVIFSLISFFLSFKNLNEQSLFIRTNI